MKLFNTPRSGTLKWRFAAALISIASFGLMGAPAAAEDYPSLNLRLAHANPSNLPKSQLDQWWADQIKERSGGKIKIKIFWGGTLGGANEILDLVSSGSVAFGATYPSFYPSRLKLSGAANALPLIFKDVNEVAAVTAKLRETKLFQEETSKNNIKFIVPHVLGIYRLLCNKPLRNMADFSGMKMRSYGQFVPKLWQSVGAVPVETGPGEIYDGLLRGGLNCSYYSYNLENKYSLYEVAKYQSTLPMGALAAYPIFVNLKEWNSWPENVRKLITDVSNEVAEKGVKLVADLNASALEELKGHGVKVFDFEDEAKFRATAPDMLEAWVNSFSSEADKKNAREYADDWKKYLAEYRAQH